MKRFIVMTAAAAKPSSCWGDYGKVAVVETDGEHRPKAINPRFKSIRRVVRCRTMLHRGKENGNSAFYRELREAEKLADELNGAAGA